MGHATMSRRNDRVFRAGACIIRIADGMDAMMIARVPHTYAGWEMLPWPSPPVTRAGVPDRRRLADVDQPGSVGLREVNELRIVVEQLVQSRDDVQGMLDCLADDGPELLRHVPAERRDADDQGLRLAPFDRFLQIRDDRNAVRFPVEHVPGVPPGLRVIDDARDLVPFRISHEAIRRLSRALTEISVAQDDGFLHASCPL